MILWGTKESVFTALTFAGYQLLSHILTDGDPYLPYPYSKLITVCEFWGFLLPTCFFGSNQHKFHQRPTFSMIWEQFGDYVHFPAWCNTMWQGKVISGSEINKSTFWIHGNSPDLNVTENVWSILKKPNTFSQKQCSCLKVFSLVVIGYAHYSQFIQ